MLFVITVSSLRGTNGVFSHSSFVVCTRHSGKTLCRSSKVFVIRETKVVHLDEIHNFRNVSHEWSHEWSHDVSHECVYLVEMYNFCVTNDQLFYERRIFLRMTNFFTNDESFEFNHVSHVDLKQ